MYPAAWRPVIGVRCSKLFQAFGVPYDCSLTSAPGGARPSSSSTASTLQDPQIRRSLGYCVQQVKQYDNENYTWIVQMPKVLRPALFVLRALNIETALVTENVRSGETALIQMRFQWWREAVSGAFKQSPPKHPVALALGAILPEHPGIKQYNIKRLLDSREADLLDTQPPLSVEGLEQYAEGTASQLLYQQLGAAAIANREADHAASHVGKAIGMATLLRGTPVHAAARRSYLPLDLCVQHGVSQEDVYSGAPTEGLKDVALAVATVARGHLDEGRRLQEKLPTTARCMLLPAVAAGHYLDALEQAGFNLYDPSLLKPVSPLRHVLSIKYHLWKGTF